MPVGRPKKYTDDVLDKLALSLRKWVKECRHKDELFLMHEWCFDNDFQIYYFGRYIDKHEGFREAYEWAKSFQEFQIAKGGLNKKLDARFSQFFLGCQHGWRSKDDADQQQRSFRNDFAKFLDVVKGEDEEDLT